MNVAILVGEFPNLSETFITDQIIGIMKLGHDVRILSSCRPQSTLLQPDVLTYSLLPKTTYLEESRPGRVGNAFGSLHNLAKIGVKSAKRIPKIVASCWPFNSTKRKFAKLLAELDTNDIDILHCHFGRQGALAVRARMLLKREFPIVTSFHGCDMADNIETEHYRCLFRHGDAFIANTDYTCGRLEELGCPAAKINILPVGINPDAIPFSERLAVDIDDVVRIVTVARLVEVKGLQSAIDAIGRLHRKNGFAINYTIIGEGHCRPALEAQIRRLGLQDVVTLLGARTRQEVFHEYSLAHIFLLPSIEYAGQAETQGLVIQEAQAAGLPVIASDTGGIAEGLINGKSGFLFPAGDSKALAAQIECLVANTADWASMGKCGREFVTQNYNNSILEQRLESIYNYYLSNCVPSRWPNNSPRRTSAR